jgi:hypothetical protein
MNKNNTALGKTRYIKYKREFIKLSTFIKEHYNKKTKKHINYEKKPNVAVINNINDIKDKKIRALFKRTFKKNAKIYIYTSKKIKRGGAAFDVDVLRNNDKPMSREPTSQKYVAALNEVSNISRGTPDCPTNKKIVLHSTQKFLFYIDDIYSKVDMYNITDKLKTSNISDVDPNIILKLWTEKNRDTTLKSQCKKDSANIPVANNQNILLKTIQDIDNMLVERNELDGYVFIKCIKALSINTKHETTVAENKYKDNTFYTSDGYKLPKYTEEGLIDQRQNLGLGIILELEPKREYTLFNFVERTVTEKANINTLINSIKTKFYTPEYSIFETKPYNEQKSSDDKITLNGSQYINLKVYAQGKGSFTIKKFLENIFSLYGIIPHENNYIHN